MGGHIATAGSVHWCTPKKILTRAEEVIQGSFNLDPCSNEFSQVGADVEYILPEHDGLEEPWLVKGPGTTIWVNPPFGRSYIHKTEKYAISQKEYKLLSKEDKKLFNKYTIKDWVKKCCEAGEDGAHVLSIIPAAVDTKHWHEYIFPAASYCFLEGRVTFDNGPKGPAPMPCAIVYFNNNQEFKYRFLSAFQDIGYVHLCRGV